MKKSKLGRNHSKFVRETISKELSIYDMHKWKLACKGFGPIHYVSKTRKQWLKEKFVVFASLPQQGLVFLVWKNVTL